MIATSQPSIASSKLWKNPHCGNSSAALSGSRLAGAHRRSSRTPSAASTCTSERATREWRMSPQITTRKSCRSGRWRRSVSASSRPWVGCAWLPSPALSTAARVRRLRAISAGVPDSAWRTTKASQCIASSVWIVSSSDSPFTADERPISKLISCAPRRLAARSNEVRVRVEGSKNKLITVRPLRRSSGRAPSRDSCRSASARSSRAWMRARSKPSSVIR